MNKIVLSIFVLFVGLSMTAQQTEVILDVPVQETMIDTSWKTGGVFGLNFGQTALKNWSAGGQNSLAIGALFSAFKNYKKDKNSWDNNLDLAYGLLQQGSSQFVKTDDKIDFSSKYGRELNREHWFLSALVNFKSQFTEGYQDPLAGDYSVISKFMAPGYALAALGLDYKPSDKFSLFVSPITDKMTFVNDDALSAAGAYGVTPGETFRNELGAYLKAVYQNEILKNVGFMSKLDMFSNYQELTHVDVAWDNLLSMKVNKYITTTLGATVLYDHDIDITRSTGELNGVPQIKVGPTTQFKQVLNIGFAYQF